MKARPGEVRQWKFTLVPVFDKRDIDYTIKSMEEAGWQLVCERRTFRESSHAVFKRPDGQTLVACPVKNYHIGQDVFVPLGDMAISGEV